jgi:hypothetical protein
MMVLLEVGWGDVDWIGLAQDRNRWIALATPHKCFLITYLLIAQFVE